MRYDIPEDELRDLYEVKRLGVHRIARKYGCNATTIQSRLHKCGVQMRTNNYGIPKSKLHDLYEAQGLGPSRIAKIFGCNVKTIYDALKRHGIRTKTHDYDITEAELRQLYEVQQLDVRDIAANYGCSVHPILYRLKKFGIQVRTSKIDIPEDELRDLYEVQKLSAHQIAKKYGCNYRTIFNRLKRCMMPTRKHMCVIPESKLRDLYEAQRLSACQIAKIYGCSTNKISHWIRQYGIRTRTPEKAIAVRFKIPDIPEQELREIYEVKRIGTYRIARKYGCGNGAVRGLLKKHGIRIRNHKEAITSRPIILTSKDMEIINGGMLGDLSLPGAGRTHNKRLTFMSKHREYICFLRSILSENIRASNIRKSDYYDKRINKVTTGYYLDSYASPTITNLFQKWYLTADGKNIKHIPRDLVLTPLTCLIWYLDDGYLRKDKRKYGTCDIYLCTDAFTMNELAEIILPQLSQFKANLISRIDNKNKHWRVHIKPQYVSQFLAYIGPCPKDIEKIFGHKWAVIGRRIYEHKCIRTEHNTCSICGKFMSSAAKGRPNVILQGQGSTIKESVPPPVVQADAGMGWPQ